MDKPSGGPRATPLGKIFGLVLCRKLNLVIMVFWRGRAFSVRRKTIVTPCISFSLIIVKSLQLRGGMQISEPRKYCLVRVIFFFGMCFLYFFCFS